MSLAFVVLSFSQPSGLALMAIPFTAAICFPVSQCLGFVRRKMAAKIFPNRS